MLVNLTNHPSGNWNPEQFETAARTWGSVYDVPFPDVPPEWDSGRIRSEADSVAKEVMTLHPDAVLCQGEMCMTAALARIFQEHEIPVYAAASGRQSVEMPKPDGTVEKHSVFRFVQFRQYCL